MWTRTTALFLAASLLTACGEFTLYDVDIATELVDEVGEPIRERAYTLCPEFEFADGEVLVEDCDEGFTDRAGLGTTGAFFQVLRQEVVDVRATVQVESVAADGGVTSFDIVTGDPELEVAVSSRYTVSRATLPVLVTRFDLVGSVNGDRRDGIPSASGEVTVLVDLPDGLGRFEGTGTVTTDASAVHRTSVDITSNYAFPVLEEAISATIDIDGYTGPGILDLSSVDGDDPRVVTGFASF